jgi:hypothetical protein
MESSKSVPPTSQPPTRPSILRPAASPPLMRPSILRPAASPRPRLPHRHLHLPPLSTRKPPPTPRSPPPIACVSGEELPDWLRFSPSSSKDGSPTPGRLSSILTVNSFVEVIRLKGKAPLVGSSSATGRAPLISIVLVRAVASQCRPPSHTSVTGGFMAVAR